MAPTTDDSDELLTIPEVAKLLEVNRSRIYQLINEGLLDTESVKGGPIRKAYRIPRKSVLRYQGGNAVLPAVKRRRRAKKPKVSRRTKLL